VGNIDYMGWRVIKAYNVIQEIEVDRVKFGFFLCTVGSEHLILLLYI
jgi:hypothetical protein